MNAILGAAYFAIILYLLVGLLIADLAWPVTLYRFLLDKFIEMR